MKITVVETPEIFNVGNAFINRGGRNLVEKIFKGHDICYIKSMESGNTSLSYPSSAFCEYSSQLLKSSDLIIVFGGSCLNRYAIHQFEFLKKLANTKILLGAGFYENIQNEFDAYGEIVNQFDLIITRDEKTYGLLSGGGKLENVIDGVDLSFWLGNEKYRLLPEKPKRNYFVLNLDSPEKAETIRRIFKERKKENPIVSWNNPTRVTNIYNSDWAETYRSYIGESWEDYLRFYGAASEVLTNRLHTFSACLSMGTPCRILFDKADYGRYMFLLKAIPELSPDPVYQKEDFEEAKKRLLKEKDKTEKILYHFLNENSSSSSR